VKIEYRPEKDLTQEDAETTAEVEGYKQDYQEALKECTASMNPADMYAELISRGMQFSMP
jgi:hypothetical protein